MSDKTYRQVLAVGVFDLFHVGHLRYLEYAKSQGRHLVVGVTPDNICFKYKHKRPVINELERLEIVNGLRCVDQSHFIPTSTEVTEASIIWIQEWEIDLVVAGGNWKASERWQRLGKGLAEKGIDVIFAPHTVGISTTELTLRIRDNTKAPNL